jgi:hypothetical protein
MSLCVCLLDEGHPKLVSVGCSKHWGASIAHWLTVWLRVSFSTLNHHWEVVIQPNSLEDSILVHVNSKELLFVRFGRSEELLNSAGPLSKGGQGRHEVAISNQSLLDVIGVSAVLKNGGDLSSLSVWKFVGTSPPIIELLSISTKLLATLVGTTMNRHLRGWELLVRENWRSNVVQLNVEIMDLIWIVTQEVFLLISGSDVLRIHTLILAVLSEEVANNGREGDPNDQDLEHEPEVEVWGSRHAFVSLRLKIDELHEGEYNALENSKATDHVACEDLCLEPTNVDQGHHDVEGVQGDVEIHHHPDTTTVRDVVLQDPVGAVDEPSGKEQRGDIEHVPESLVGVTELDKY